VRFLRRFWLPILLLGVGVVMGMGVLVAQRARGTIELAPLVSDGMVLQRDSRVTIAGRARAGWPVVVSGTWGDATVTRADEHGRWRARLRTRGAGGPYHLLVWAGDSKAVNDVWIGETWLCSGQSNMAFTLRETEPGEPIDLPRTPIRLFNVGLSIADTPQETCTGKWVAASADTAADFSAACWYFGRALQVALDVPIGLVAAAASGTDIEGWTSERGLLEVPEMAAEIEVRRRTQTGVTVAGGWRPGLFFNAMIAPLAPYTFGGVAWYQGEANIPRAAQYARLFPAMIRDWRAWFERELPFAFVQLPGFTKYRPHGAIAELREAQRGALALPHTGMVVSIDLGDNKDIHSPSKAIIGLRLAGWALSELYGRTDRPASGPIYRAMQIKPWGIQILFDHTDGGLEAASQPLVGFEMAGADRKFYAAWAVISGHMVIVRSPRVPAPVAVRYAWDEAPTASLRNRAGLPGCRRRRSVPTTGPA